MTGYTVHTGSNDKFRDGWDRVFSAKPRPGKKEAGKKETTKTETARPAKAAKPVKGKKS